MSTSPDDRASGDDLPGGYAEALAELEEILERLDDDDVDVDVLGSQVARAATLIRFCRARIRTAQLSVEEIVAELDELAAHDDGRQV